MTNEKWFTVLENDDGITEDGPPDACYYCERKVGEEHARDCITIRKTVVVRYSFEIPVTVPHSDDQELVKLDRTHPPRSPSLALQVLAGAIDGDGCLCGEFQCDVIHMGDGEPWQFVKGGKPGERRFKDGGREPWVCPECQAAQAAAAAAVKGTD